VAALRRVSVAGRRTARRMAQAQPDPLRAPIVRQMRALVRGLCRTARAHVPFHRAIATTGSPRAIALTSRNRARRVLRAPAAIVRRIRTAEAARMSRHRARTVIGHRPPTRMAIVHTRPLHSRIRLRRVRTLLHRAPTRPRVAVTLHLRTRLLRARTLHRAAATPRPARAIVAVAGAITAVAAAVEAIMAAVETVVAADRTAAAVVVADRTVAVAVPVAAAPTATNSRCDVQGPLRSRNGPFVFL
jgi:hypothetical protein